MRERTTEAASEREREDKRESLCEGEEREGFTGDRRVQRKHADIQSRAEVSITWWALKSERSERRDLPIIFVGMSWADDN